MESVSCYNFFAVCYVNNLEYDVIRHKCNECISFQNINTWLLRSYKIVQKIFYWFQTSAKPVYTNVPAYGDRRSIIQQRFFVNVTQACFLTRFTCSLTSLLKCSGGELFLLSFCELKWNFLCSEIAHGSWVFLNILVIFIKFFLLVEITISTKIQ